MKQKITFNILGLLMIGTILGHSATFVHAEEVSPDPYDYLTNEEKALVDAGLAIPNVIDVGGITMMEELSKPATIQGPSSSLGTESIQTEDGDSYKVIVNSDEVNLGETNNNETETSDTTESTEPTPSETDQEVQQNLETNEMKDVEDKQVDETPESTTKIEEKSENQFVTILKKIWFKFMRCFQ